MKYLKIIGLIAIVAVALSASSGGASAATLTSPSGTEYTGTVTMTATESLLLKAGFANITCTESTMSGTGKTNNEEHFLIIIGTIRIGPCGNVIVTILAVGTLTIHKGTGVVTGSGTEVTYSTLGTSCVYGTGAGTTLGTLKGGTTASLQISANLTKISGGFLCANPASWSGKYTVTTPDTLLVD